jgi:cell division protease FtsH
MINRQNYILLLVSLFVFVIILSIGYQEIAKEQKISLENFLQKINQGEIIKVTIANKIELIGQTKEGKIFKTTKDPEKSLTDILKDYQIPSSTIFKLEVGQETINLKEVGLGLLLNIFLPFLLIGWIFWQILKQTQRGASQIFTFGKSSIKVYNPNDPDRVTFKDVAGLQEAKEELMEVVEFLKTPDKFIKIGAKIPKGVLLIGPPGTGKTLMARACAAEAGVPFFYISGSEFVEMFVGVGASRVRDAFAIAKKNQPCILFIDELDAIGKIRGGGITGGHEEREQTLNQILVEMDGFEKGIKVVVLAATNRGDTLDPALLRPGRFDRKIILDLPDIKAREEILKIHLNDKKIRKINLKQIAERTPGFSGADLANLCNEAAILAARKNKDFIDQQELLEAIEKILLGPERKTKAYSKKEKEIAAYHEAGHALVAHYLPYSSPVQKISIISRGRAGGYTLKTPLEERNFYFRREFIDELASILGGFAAERIIFNDNTTGASNDLEIATDLAKQLVVKFGMSEKIGPVAYSKPLKEFIIEKEYSEKTAELIDEEVRNLINLSLDKALMVLNHKKDKLEKVAKILIKKEVIEKKQFEKIVGEDKGSFNFPQEISSIN